MIHEYQKKQFAIFWIAETLNPMAIREVMEMLEDMAQSKERKENEG